MKNRSSLLGASRLHTECRMYLLITQPQAMGQISTRVKNMLNYKPIVGNFSRRRLPKDCRSCAACWLVRTHCTYTPTPNALYDTALEMYMSFCRVQMSMAKYQIRDQLLLIRKDQWGRSYCLLDKGRRPPSVGLTPQSVLSPSTGNPMNPSRCARCVIVISDVSDGVLRC